MHLNEPMFCAPRMEGEPRTQLQYGTRGEILIRAYMQDRLSTAHFIAAVESLYDLGVFDEQCPSMLDWAYRLPI